MQTINATEAARRLGISDKTIRKWILSGKLPAKRGANGHYAIQTSDFLLFLVKEAVKDAVRDGDVSDIAVPAWEDIDQSIIDEAVKEVIASLKERISVLPKETIFYTSQHKERRIEDHGESQQDIL